MSNHNSLLRAAILLVALVLCTGCGEGDEAPVGAMEPNIEALPSLVQSLKHRDAAARTRAAVAIGRMGPIAKEAVPALTAALKDREVSVRAASAHALGKIGPNAKDALNDLQSLMSQAPLRDVAAEAVKEISE